MNPWEATMNRIRAAKLLKMNAGLTTTGMASVLNMTMTNHVTLEDVNVSVKTAADKALCMTAEESFHDTFVNQWQRDQDYDVVTS